MSQTSSRSTVPEPETSSGGEPHHVTVVDRKVPVVFSVVTLALALAVVLGSQSGETTFRLAARREFISLPEITVPSEAGELVQAMPCR